jgi:hypothetical protein
MYTGNVFIACSAERCKKFVLGPTEKPGLEHVIKYIEIGTQGRKSHKEKVRAI